MVSALGEMVGGYEIVREIGSGGMGVVYLAEHPVLGKRAAVKVLRQDLAQRPDLALRFRQEARAAAQVTHPNSVEIFDLTALQDGRLCILMEYVDGQTLAQRLAVGALSPNHSLTILRQICRGLAAFHAKGITHRDVKPQNVVLTYRDGMEVVKILDFGLAKTASMTTQVGVAMGTPHYMAPEQISGGNIDPRVDVYATGVLAFQLFTGAVPFDGGSFEEIAGKHLFMVPQLPARMPPPLKAVLERALAKSPAERFPHAAEFGAALELAQTASYPPATPPRGRPAVVIERGEFSDDSEETTPITIDRPREERPKPTFPVLPSFGANLAARLAADHYAFLGVDRAASDMDILAAARRIDLELAEAGDVEEAVAVAERLQAARQTLLSPASRALYDAEMGNIFGVIQCVRAGLHPSQVAELHEEFTRRFADRASRSDQLRLEAMQLCADGEITRAIPVLEQALALTPLSLPLHRLHMELFQKVRRVPA